MANAAAESHDPVSFIKLYCFSRRPMYFCDSSKKPLYARPNTATVPGFECRERGGVVRLFPDWVTNFVCLPFCNCDVSASHLLGPKRLTKDKLQTFESGIAQQGNARQPMAIKYFLVAILFVLFDVEVIFFYPYAVNFRELGWDGFWAVMLFVGLFLAGFIYIIRKKALQWED